MRIFTARGLIANRARVFTLGILFVMLSGFGPAHVAKSDSAWKPSDFSKVRLIGGRKVVDGVEQVFAGVEIALEKNWKTYWCRPGDAGGVPPVFSWSQSKNVASVDVMYPAPQRFKDFGGSTIGYKNLVVFPLRIMPERSGEPVELKLALSYGICSTICVPVNESLSLSIPPGRLDKFPQALDEAMSRVPREGEKRKDSDPRLLGHLVRLDGEKPEIVFDVDFGGHASRGDVFVEVTDHVYLPMTRFKPDKPDRFVISLKRVKDRAKLKGKVLRITLVSDHGQSVEYLKID